ncbi:ph-response sensor protein [Pseudocyphellaria aurata]|nr:ph-response sensor protein [Pseudocyphellaria aurata]
MIGSPTNSAQDFSQPISKPKSILSKFTAPFTPRKRNPTEFFIKLKEPHRQYAPADRVRGAVVVTVIKPLRITHLVVCLHGFVKVFANAKSATEVISPDGGLLGGGAGKRGSEYFGNGFASLFENEVTLGGEGRLEMGSFEFEFDLELPSAGLPSSISFERGTISYLVTSTLTRPTTISPVATCHHPMQLVETVDIAAFPRPKPRVVSVETVSRRSMTNFSNRRSVKTSNTGKGLAQWSIGSQGSANGSSSSDPQPPIEPPQSPVLSTTSFASGRSSNISTHHTNVTRPSPNGRGEANDQASNDDSADHMVTATIELLHRGCLPGDKLPIEISINHNKPVKILQGIIITMYREGHVDTHPAIPLGPSHSRKKQEYEDYYPKSRTGLGGLSLSSAGSSSSFRKDLSQRFVPLIVDPHSLTAVIKTSILVPDDLFPTISSVPGGMITFKYFVEVVIDLRGRLTGQERFLPRLQMTSGTPRLGYGDYTSNGMDRSEGFMTSATAGLDIVGTEQIRREKGVVACSFEVIVGTRDSGRRRGRQADERRKFDALREDLATGSEDERAVESWGILSSQQRADGMPQDADHQTDPQFGDERIYAGYGSDYWQPDAIPPPIIEEDLDEKSRIRRAEQRLLPSAPPTHNEPLSYNPEAQQPSAPEEFDDEDFAHVRERSSLYQSMPNGASTASMETARREHDLSHEASTHVNDSASSPAGPGDDKQEMERQRLQMAASAPEDPPHVEVLGTSSPAHPRVDAIAPIIDEDYPGQHQVPPESIPVSQSQLQTQSHESRLRTESLPLYQK